MRLVIAALVAIALPTVAAAQSKGSARGSSRGHSPAVAPWSSMTSTLPPIGLGLPPIGLAPPSPPAGSKSVFAGHGPRFDRGYGRPHFDSRQHGFGSVVYVVPPFYPSFFSPYADVFAPPFMSPMPGVAPINYPPPEPPPPPTPPAPPAPATGLLRLDLEAAPARAQVFVDGYFVGTLDDLRSQLLLETGPHKIEVREPGYRPVGFDVMVVADRSITYSSTFQSLDGTMPPPAPAATPSAIYFIPTCYLGNVPPQPATLPAGCDISKLSTYKP